jgi:vancomycin permeability regulator SanA
LPSSLYRGPWRYLRDRDVLHAAAVTALALLGSAGLLWLAYLIHVWRVAVRSPTKPARRTTVLVFGRRLIDDQPEADYQARLRRALALIEDDLVGPVWLLGGHSGGRISEAEAGRRWLLQNGLANEQALQLEQASIDSLENLRHARSLLQRAAPLDLPPVALLTSRYHLARCLCLARLLGFDCVPIAAEDRLPGGWRMWRRLLLESAYLMWIDIGQRWARLIGHQRMAARLR